MTPSSPKSSCCGAPVKRDWSDTSDKDYFCVKCFKGCDLLPSESPDNSNASSRGASAESNKAASGDSICSCEPNAEGHSSSCMIFHSSEPSVQMKPSGKDIARDFMYRFVLPAISSSGERIWELKTDRPTLEAYFQDILDSKFPQ
jgi:hypothetical protein